MKCKSLGPGPPGVPLAIEASHPGRRKIPEADQNRSASTAVLQAEPSPRPGWWWRNRAGNRAVLELPQHCKEQRAPHTLSVGKAMGILLRFLIFYLKC